MPSSITLTVSHLPTSTSFFLSALQPLNYVFRGRQEHTIGFGPASPPNTPADFWITQEIPGVPAGAAHVAFPAASRAQVQDFFLAALKAGGKIHGEPCQRDASGYYSAAVIDFDGNSIEAVYRPAFGDDANRENADTRSVVSHRSATVRAPSVVAAPKSVVSNMKSVRAPSQVASKAPSYVSSPPDVPLQNTQPKPKPSGDVLGSLINEARNAANVARDLVNSMTPNLISSGPPASSTGNNSTGGGSGAGEAIVGTLLGVAAGAALHYAFSNRSKEDSRDDRDEHKFVPPPRPSVTGRSVSEPVNVVRAEYSTVPSEYPGVPEKYGYRAIEPAPSAYTYTTREPSDQKLITMYDHDHPAPTDKASTIRPASVTRRVSMDSGVGLGVVPRDFDAASHASSKASRQSKKSTNAPPPTSYRAPTALTVKSKASGASGGGGRSRSRASSTSRLGRSLSGRSSAEQPRSRSQSRHSSRSRRSRRDEFEDNAPEDEEARTVLHVAESVRRSSSRVSSHHSHAESKVASHVSVHHSQAGSKVPSQISMHQSQAGSKAPSHVTARESQAGSKAASHISMHESHAGSKAPSHVSAHESHAASKASSHASAHQSQAGSKVGSYVSGHDSQATIKPASRISSRHSRRDPAEYPLPPSRAATWAGSDIGKSSSFVSARSNFGPAATGPRTIIGKVNHLVRDGGNVTDEDDKAETASVVSKQKELARLDVTDREVRPEDSVSQISVESRRSRRSKASSRR
ncbi:uncharacterized protein Z520_00317 [Fonsecaea multimorphosa CBS 102226]|uniref:VOC domain-containing protein n=1 Tax=Fonsecaea multimorphosa CBS 102226 TaxID=1442371 RepID=A0A0D2HP69_9EURO|nr:uncharacterized protein Z520_00317 [Fonsecaea multimorphosa CBS 102226]KIY03626.1 hypothetical protein Z520_00317 [Fonsecaea multimorphosa CBS 102226]OAL32327.1 hypothetical protein AYO22_00349 [Fonsecaea multimorphosa]